jgi:hypothetical protein
MPNFYIAGGARCGSTSLEAYCRVHPEIFMSAVKEPNFFSYGYGGVPFAGPGRDRFYSTSIKDLKTYRQLFKHAGAARVIGEASINYLLHPEACAGIHALTPEARLVFILRQPVDRAWSSFQRSRFTGVETEEHFIDAWRDDARRRAAGHWSCIHRYKSLYAQHLHCWFDTFPRQQIKVILFDDLKNDPNAVMHDLYTFLGVDPGFKPDTSVIHNQTGEISNPLLRNIWLRSSALRGHLAPVLPLSWRGRLFRYLASSNHTTRSSARLPADLRAELTAELREGIGELEDLIDRDLSAWYG